MLRAGGIDRRYYELCVLSELRDRLRAGDVWVVGSRRYRTFEERLISRETLKELEQGGTLPIAVDADFERFISARRARLNERLAAIDVKAKGGLLPDVMLDKGVLKITPIEKSTPPEAEALATRLDAMLPRIRSPISSRRWRDGHCSPTASPICGPAKPPSIRKSSWRASSPTGSISA